MTSEERYWTPQQVADKLGYSVDTIHRWAQTGQIPVAFRAGGRIRFDITHVIAALEQDTKAAR